MKRISQVPEIFYFAITVFIVSVGINYIWEMAQMPLFQNMPYNNISSWLLCFRAALGDGLIILIIWMFGFTVFREIAWFGISRISSILMLAGSGIVIAAAIELFALSTSRWLYSDFMPIIPVIRVGLSPVLQMAVLPWCVMKICERYFKKHPPAKMKF